MEGLFSYVDDQYFLQPSDNHLINFQVVLEDRFPPFQMETLYRRELLDTFLKVFNSRASRNQYEDVCIKFFSSSLTGKAKEWYNNIPPKTITSWETFQKLFMKIFVENEGYLSRSMCVPCLVNHNIFGGVFVSFQTSKISDHVSEEEDESSSIHDIHLQ